MVKKKAGRPRKERFKGNWNLLGEFKEEDFEYTKMKKERT
jgi:hypothetical protein